MFQYCKLYNLKWINRLILRSGEKSNHASLKVRMQSDFVSLLYNTKKFAKKSFSGENVNS